MKVRRGPKGKYFTDVVRKLPVRVLIQTHDGRITGTIHVHPDHRALDELNQIEGFLAVTEAVVESGSGPFETEFIALNKSQIIWVHPLKHQGEESD